MASAALPPTAPSRATTTRFRVAFDVEQLERSAAFYKSALGFEVQRTERAGLLHESRFLTSPLFGGVEIELRAAFGKRVFACQPGGVLRFGLAVPSLGDAIRLAAGKVRWVGPSPEAAPDEPRDPPRVRFIDPDGYVIELFEVR